MAEMSAQPMEWFSGLAEVPGVDWHSPEGVVPDPRLAAARPVVDPDSYLNPPIVWVDGYGRPIHPSSVSYRSPAELELVERLGFSW